MTTSTPAILLVCGLKFEASARATRDVLWACGDAQTVQSQLDGHAERNVRMVVSFGLCGGLDPALRRGDIVLGTEVVSESASVAADSALTRALERRLRENGERPILGRIAAAEAPVLTREAKTRLRSATGAVAVDMESMAASQFARKKEAPFVMLRAVSDAHDRNLPPLVLAAVDAAGGIKHGKVIRELIRSPKQIHGLVHAARDSGAAMRALRRCMGLGGLLDALPSHL